MLRPKQLSMLDIFSTLGKTMRISGEDQLVSSVNYEEDKDGKGYTIKIYTTKGDWSKDIYK